MGIKPALHKSTKSFFFSGFIGKIALYNFGQQYDDAGRPRFARFSVRIAYLMILISSTSKHQMLKLTEY